MAKGNRPKQDKHSGRQSGSKETGFNARFKRWFRRNEKIIFFCLLLIISPFFAFPVGQLSQSGQASRIDSVVFGQEITQAEIDRVRGLMGIVGSLAPAAVQTAPLSLGRQLYDRRAGFMPRDFFIYRAKAKELGLTVSNKELGQRIQQLWRMRAAAEYAAKEASATADPSNPSMQYFQRQQLMQSRLEELEKGGTFDSQDWLRVVQETSRYGRTRFQVRDIEEMLRDVYLVGKLEEYVLSQVQVTPKQIYEKYREDDQTRKLSWIAAQPSEALLEKVNAGVEEKSLRPFYDARVSTRGDRSFYRQFALRAEYVMIPREHFVNAVKESVTDEEIKTYYTDNRNEFRRPVILPDESLFALRTSEEQKAHEDALYLPFEEVEEKAREKVEKKKADREISTLATQLRSRLFPPESAKDAEAATPKELAEEFPFLVVGETDWAIESEAEETFGQAYSKTSVSGWYSQARTQGQDRRVKIEAPKMYQTLADEKGYVFYTRIDTRASGTPRFREIEQEVRDSMVKIEALKAVRDALEESQKSLDVEAGLAGLEGKEIDVKVNGETVKIPLEGFEEASSYAGRRGSVMVWKPEDDKEDTSDDEADEDPLPEEIVHQASSAIRDAGYAIEAEGETAVAEDEKEGICYFVLLGDIIYPNTGVDFEKRRDSLAVSLLREKRQEFFDEWINALRRSAFGAPAEASGEEEEVARASE